MKSWQTVFFLLTILSSEEFSKILRKKNKKIYWDPKSSWIWANSSSNKDTGSLPALQSAHNFSLWVIGTKSTCFVLGGWQPLVGASKVKKHLALQLNDSLIKKHIDLINAFISFQSDTTGISHKWENPVVVFQAEASSIAIWTMVQCQNTHTLHVCCLWW